MTKDVATTPERRSDGTFPQGVSGNPLGRPKGSKNQITLLRESLELQLREQAAPQMSEVLEKAFELALAGDRTMLKLLIEMHLSKSVDPNVKGQEKVTINIKGPETKQEIIEVLDTNGDV